MLLPKQLEEAASHVEDINWNFRTFLKMESPDDLDTVVNQLHEELFREYDCIACSNCCKETTTDLTKEDIGRISRELNMKPKVFIKKYLGKSEGEFMIKNLPCPFLGEEGCTIYDCRPEACREYPHTDKDEMLSRLISLMENCAICPVVFELVERLKQHYADAFKRYQQLDAGRLDSFLDGDDMDDDLSDECDDWIEAFDSKTPDEMYPFMMETLLEGHPDVFLEAIDIIDSLVELMDNLVVNKQYDKMLELHRIYFERYPDSFPEEHGVLDEYIMEYALYGRDTRLLKSCLNRMIEDADTDGYEPPYPKLEKMLYYGYLDEYKHLIQNIYSKLDMDLWEGDTHGELSHVYLMIRLQETYCSLKNGQDVNSDTLAEELTNYGMHTHKELHIVVGCLSEGHVSIRSRIEKEWKAGSRAVMAPLVWFFTRWMLDNKGIGFAASYSIWLGIIPFLSCERTKVMKGIPGDFALNESACLDHVEDTIYDDSRLNPYTICYVWGMSYLYEFLTYMGMVDELVCSAAVKVAKACKYHIVSELKNELWQYDFINAWPAPGSGEWELTGERQLFTDSYTSIPELEEYIADPELYTTRGFLNQESDVPYHTQVQVQVPVQRTEPKIGRNDPCPCGSGKKYKKCCG